MSDRAGLAALLGVLDQTRDWPAFLAAATSQEIRDEFLRLAEAVLASSQLGATSSGGCPPRPIECCFGSTTGRASCFSTCTARCSPVTTPNGSRTDWSRSSRSAPSCSGKPFQRGTARTCRASPAVRRGGKLPRDDVDLLNTWQGAARRRGHRPRAAPRGRVAANTRQQLAWGGHRGCTVTADGPA
jgi:hypothetical protein